MPRVEKRGNDHEIGTDALFRPECELGLSARYAGAGKVEVFFGPGSLEKLSPTEVLNLSDSVENWAARLRELAIVAEKDL